MYPIHLKIAVFGASGAGKSTLFEIMRKISPHISVHRKDTTRQPRTNESSDNSLDLQFVSKDEFDKNRMQYDVAYHKYGSLYGIRRDQLIEAFTEKKIHCIIINDVTAIQQFKSMYPDVIAIYIHVDPSTIPGRLQMREGVDIQERMNRIRQGYIEFLENNTLFDHVVLNFWEIDNAIRQFQNIIHHYVRKATSNLR